VINFSFGNVAGPHDGTSDLEQAIDEIIRKRREIARLEVVIPSGNSHLARLHAQITFDAEAPEDQADRSDGNRGAYQADLNWRVLPDDRTPSFLEIWLPRTPPGQSEAKSRILLYITSPGGLRSQPLDESIQGAGLQLRSEDGAVLCDARYRFIGPPHQSGHVSGRPATNEVRRASAARENESRCAVRHLDGQPCEHRSGQRAGRSLDPAR
jgi:hypothetical protein